VDAAFVATHRFENVIERGMVQKEYYNYLWFFYSLTSSEAGVSVAEREQIEQRLKADLDKLKYLLTPLIKTIRQGEKPPRDINWQHGEKKFKDLLDLRKKHFYYHWKYLSHFISSLDINTCLQLPFAYFQCCIGQLTKRFRKVI
jgi:hypothetical protein